jgi:hypothetical protein
MAKNKNNMKLTVTVIKRNTKDNITYSVSKYNDGAFRSINITGTLECLSGYFTKDKVDMSQQIVDAELPVTLIINNQETGEAIIEECEDIFHQRNLNGDFNPAVSLEVEARSLSIPGNILITAITNVSINEDAVLEDSAEVVLAKLKKNKDNKMKPSLQASISSERGASASSTSTSSTSRFSGFSNLLKEYF